MSLWVLWFTVLQNGGEGASSDDEDAADNNAIPGTPPNKKVCLQTTMSVIILGFISHISVNLMWN